MREESKPKKKKRIRKVKCPQVVISSYEEMLMWHSYPSEDDDKKENKN